MSTFFNFAIKAEYARISERGNSPGEVSSLINWDSFRHFLGYPTSIPDHFTIWIFRECLITTGKETAIWEELQRQIDQKGLTIRRGVIQDASFITSDPDHARGDIPEGIRHRRGEAATVPG